MKKMKTKRPTERFDWREEVRVSVEGMPRKYGVSLKTIDHVSYLTCEKLRKEYFSGVSTLEKYKAIGFLTGLSGDHFGWWFYDYNSHFEGPFKSPTSECLKKAGLTYPAKAGRPVLSESEFLNMWNQAVSEARRLLDQAFARAR